MTAATARTVEGMTLTPAFVGWIKTMGKVIHLFIWGFMTLSTLNRSYQEVVGRAVETSIYIQLVKVLNCKLPTNNKQLPAYLLEVGPGSGSRSQRWEARVLPLFHLGPQKRSEEMKNKIYLLLIIEGLWYIYFYASVNEVPSRV